MCLNAETVEALHAVTSELKETQAQLVDWVGAFERQEEPAAMMVLPVTRAEAERIFADRIAALEARLREQGWERKIRVESPLPGDQK